MESTRDKAPWKRPEEAILKRAFISGVDVDELARRHRRSTTGIESKLLELGCLGAQDESELSSIEHQYLVELEPANGWTFEDIQLDIELEQTEEAHAAVNDDVLDERWEDVHADYEPMDEDWGVNFDDLDSRYWEGFLGGPDDDQLEFNEEYFS